MTDESRELRGQQDIASIFNRVAAGYDREALRIFPFCADRLVSILRPGAGQKILDVATGTGAVAMAAAQAVGPQGRVIGIDIADAMLARAQENVARMGLRNVDLHLMHAASLEFRGHYFDHVVCSFGLFFVPDMVVALREWRRVLKPGGSVMFTSFGPDAFQPMIDWLREEIASLNIALPEDPPRLQTPEACVEALREAGFSEPDVKPVQLGYHLRSEGEWWDAAYHSALRGLIDRVPATEREGLRDRYLARLAGRVTGDGLWIPIPALFARAVY